MVLYSIMGNSLVFLILSKDLSSLSLVAEENTHYPLTIKIGGNKIKWTKEYITLDTSSVRMRLAKTKSYIV